MFDRGSVCRVELFRGWLELQGGYAPCKLLLSNLFAYSLARQRSCTPLPSIFRAHRGRPSVGEERARAYSVVRFFQMIPAGLPQATNKELLRHNTQLVCNTAHLSAQPSRVARIRSNPVKAFCAPIKITNWLIHPITGADVVHDFTRSEWEECGPRRGRCSLRQYCLKQHAI
jgi:hypothetical protein